MAVSRNPYFFVEGDVYELPKRTHWYTFKSIVWTLVDSDESPSGVQYELVQDPVMNLWSREEI
jgi:hypothetical protein